MAKKLRDQLIGAWKLVTYVEKPVDGSAAVHPLGERPTGIIMYTPDGYREEASTYIAYSGPFHVDEEKKTLTHSVLVSLFPNWTGQTPAWSRSKEMGCASARNRRSGLLGR